jgi:hypothetical protein
MLSQSNSFRHIDKLQAIDLAEKNGTKNRNKSITVQHFNDSGHPDSPAELVLTEAGHSPVQMTSIAGGYYVATENDPDQVNQVLNLQQSTHARDKEYQSR